MDKLMRMHSVTSTIANGFVYLPDEAEWLVNYVHELITFPRGKHDDQADATSQGLDWVKTVTARSGFEHWLVKEHRKRLVLEGRLDELRKPDEVYPL